MGFGCPTIDAVNHKHPAIEHLPDHTKGQKARRTPCMRTTGYEETFIKAIVRFSTLLLTVSFTRQVELQMQLLNRYTCVAENIKGERKGNF